MGDALVIFLELDDDPTIADTACALYPHFLCSDDPHGDLALQWLQAIFTKRADGKFVGGPIQTMQELLPVDPTESQFTRFTIKEQQNSHEKQNIQYLPHIWLV